MSKGSEQKDDVDLENPKAVKKDREPFSEQGLSNWLNKYGVKVDLLTNPETQQKLKEAMSATLSATDRYVVKGDPGYPSELTNIFKAKYSRGLVVEKVLNFEAGDNSQKAEAIIGYDGLDVEIWFLKGNGVRLVSFKRLGYKNINAYLGHEEANVFRDITLLTLDQMQEEVTALGDKNFESGIFLAQALQNYCYGDEIRPQEQAIIKARGVDQSKIIQKTRVTSSELINVTPGLTNDEARSLVTEARRQTEAVSKLMQLEALRVDHDKEFQSNFGMRSMTAELGGKLGERQLLSDYLNSLEIEADLYLQSENGQVGEYSKPLQAKIAQIGIFLKEKLHASSVSEALKEFYQRPIHNIREYNRVKVQIDNLINNIDATNAERALELFVAKITSIIAPEVVHPEGYFINDLYIRFLIAEALQNSQQFLILHADREGMLYLNSRIGVKNVDEGVVIQAEMAQSAVEKINNIDGVSAAYCLRNVDENILVIIEKDENAIVTNLGTIFEHLNLMYAQMDTIKQFRLTSERSAFQSHAVGLLLLATPDQFGDPQQILMTADSYSAVYKRARQKQNPPYAYLSDFNLDQIKDIFVSGEIPLDYRAIWKSREQFIEALSRGILSPFNYSPEERKQRVLQYYKTNPLIDSGLVYFMEKLVKI